MSIERTLIVDWKGLQRMGWPYCRAHTWRLMAETVKAKKRLRGRHDLVATEIPNPDRFPQCFKLGHHRNSHPVWRVSEVLAYFEAHGLAVTQDWNAS
jgi:hypothetical protein